MHLKDALTIAAKHVATEGHARCVVLTPGWVHAANNYSGCSVPCDEVKIDAAVDCLALLRMVRAIGSGPTLTLEKGRKVRVSGEAGTASYSLQAIPEAKTPAILDAPTAGWTDITEPQMEALAALATLVESKVYNQALAGVRLTPSWAAVGAVTLAGVVWTSGLVTEPFTAPREAFLGMGGPGRLCVDKTRLWVEESSRQRRWVLGLDVDWPDSIVNQIAASRGEAGRVTAAIDMEELAALGKQATAISETKLDRFALTIDTGHVELTGGDPSASYGASAYAGRIKALVSGGAVGSHVRADELTRVATVVCAVGGQKYVSIGATRSPILLWGGEDGVMIEGMALPALV